MTKIQLNHFFCSLFEKERNKNRWQSTGETDSKRFIYLFGRMLGISMDHKVDMAKMLSYNSTAHYLSVVSTVAFVKSKSRLYSNLWRKESNITHLLAYVF